MSLHLHVHPQPGDLLEAAAAAFLEPLPRGLASTPPQLLLLRQGGLRDDLLALAAARGVPGWFDPPIAVFAQIPDVLGATGVRPAGDYERLVLVERALRELVAEAASAHGLRPGDTVFAGLNRPESYVDALDRFFGDLVSEGVSADDFEAATTRRPGHPGFEARRDAEVARLYRRYLSLLSGADARDGRDRLIDTARAIAADPDGLARRLGGRREIRIVGLQDLKGGWVALLRVLAASPAIDTVRIYTSTALPLPADLGGVLEDDCLPPRVAQLAVAEEDVRDAITRMAFAAPDPDREVEEVAVRVRALIDAGTPPHRIAVVARQARPYVDLVSDTLDRVGVSVTARRRYGFATIPVVRALLALFAVAAEGWTRRGLVELAAQPYLGIRLDTRLLDHIGFRRRVMGLDGWIAALERLHAEAVASEAAAEDDEEGTRRAWLPPSGRVSSALERFGDFARQARRLDGRHSLAAWLQWLDEFLADDPWKVERSLWRAPDGTERVIRLDLAGWRGLRSIVREWHEAVATWGGADEPLDVQSFERRLREMLSGDAALWTGTRRGVHVLEALAAAQRSFDHVFLVGLDSGRIPVRAPRSPIFDDDDRDRLIDAGLPLEARATWDERERELFRLLTVAARASLCASWSRLDASGAEVAPSAFAEAWVEEHGVGVDTIPTSRVLTPGMPLVPDAGALRQARHAARIERIRDSGALSPWNGAIDQPGIAARIAERLGEDYVWSPTQLEAYAKCPWAWFSARMLRITKLEDPELDIDARARGSLYHDALRRFYEAARVRMGGPVFLRAGDAEWARELLRTALSDAMRAAREELWLGHPALRPTKEDELGRELQKYVEWEIQFNEELHDARKHSKFPIVRTAVDAHELQFEDVLLERDGVRVRLRGTIDRVEVGIDERQPCDHLVSAVDYKSSRYSAPGGGKKEAWDDAVVLQVPLYAHALLALRPGSEVARTEYRAVRQRDVVHPLRLYRIEKKTDRLVRDEEAAQRLEGALDAVARHVRAARDGVYPASPAASCKCPDFCHAWDICRVRGGPASAFDF